MGKSHKKGLAIVAVITVIIIGVIALIPTGNQGQAPNIGLTNIPNTAPAPSAQAYEGYINFNKQDQDSLVIGTSYVDGTDVKTIYYTPDKNGNLVEQRTSTGGIAKVYADKTISTITAELNIPSGKDFTIDVPNTVASSYKIGTAYVCDLNNDGVDTICLPFDIRDVKRQGDNDAEISYNVKLYDGGTLSLNSPADQTGLGTGKTTTCDIQWRATVSDEGDAAWLTGVRVISSSLTGGDTVQDSDSTVFIAGKATKLTKFVDDEKSSTFEWEYDLGEEYLDQNAILLAYPNNGIGDYDFRTQLKTNFIAIGDTDDFQLELDITNAQGVTTEITDSVTCTA